MMIGTPGHENHVDHIISYHDDHDSSADNCNWDTIGGHFRTHMTIMMTTLVPGARDNHNCKQDNHDGDHDKIMTMVTMTSTVTTMTR